MSANTLADLLLFHPKGSDRNWQVSLLPALLLAGIRPGIDTLLDSHVGNIPSLTQASCSISSHGSTVCNCCFPVAMTSSCNGMSTDCECLFSLIL